MLVCPPPLARWSPQDKAGNALQLRIAPHLHIAIDYINDRDDYVTQPLPAGCALGLQEAPIHELGDAGLRRGMVPTGGPLRRGNACTHVFRDRALPTKLPVLWEQVEQPKGKQSVAVNALPKELSEHRPSTALALCLYSVELRKRDQCNKVLSKPLVENQYSCSASCAKSLELPRACKLRCEKPHISPNAKSYRAQLRLHSGSEESLIIVSFSFVFFDVSLKPTAGKTRLTSHFKATGGNAIHAFHKKVNCCPSVVTPDPSSTKPAPAAIAQGANAARCQLQNPAGAQFDWRD